MTFNEILLQERKRRGLSQEDLAGIINVSRQAVSKWETGDAMPDLPKLLALADSLDISLDALCGREVFPVPDTTPAPRSKQSKWGRVVLRAVLIALLALVCFLGRPQTADTNTPALLDTVPFTVSGLNFSGRSGIAVVYRFTPSISGEGLTYQIIFTDSDGKIFPIDAPCDRGVCAGEATLPNGYGSYGVTISVTNGSVKRNVAVAQNLTFSHTGASWTPIES